jgi:protein-L-isoaspartate O-methyltransferase
MKATLRGELALSITTETRKWTNVSAGPRQVKDLQKAMGALRSEGTAHDEITGVVGGEEHTWSYMSLMSPPRAEVAALDEAIKVKYGYEITRDNVRTIIADYEAALPEARKSRPVEDSRRSAEEEAQRNAEAAERAAREQAEQDARNAVLNAVMAKAPAGAKALIYAQGVEDESDPMTDYFHSATVRTVAIGWRFSSREDFRALRAAAATFPETAHMASEETLAAWHEARGFRQHHQDTLEHRDNHSMGAGNYLSDHGWAGSGSGWLVKSADFPCKWVHLTEDAIPATVAAPEPERAVRQPGQPRAKVIGGDVLDILSRATAEGNAVRIADRLDRATYVAVNEVLSAAGGKWNRKAQAHLFPEDAAPILASLLDDGSIVRPQDEGYFPTPADVVARMADAAGLEPGMEVLEPSAGDGAIARTLAGYEHGCIVDCIELNAKRAFALMQAGYARSVTAADFLAVPQRAAYDRVVMNPPFADKADIAHVTHALGFLRPGGLLVAIMSNGVTFREDRATADFRDMVEDAGGTIEPLPEGAFKESGTGIHTVLVTIPA